MPFAFPPESAFAFAGIPKNGVADATARSTASTWEPARIAAADGAPLEAWLFTPIHPNGSGVILLHGVGATRRSTANIGTVFRLGIGSAGKAQY